jgi:hypothetical protein
MNFDMLRSGVKDRVLGELEGGLVVTGDGDRGIIKP